MDKKWININSEQFIADRETGGGGEARKNTQIEAPNVKERLEAMDRREAEEKKKFEDGLDLLFREGKKDLTEQERDRLSEIHKKAEAVDAPWVFELLKEMGMKGQREAIFEFRPEDVDVLREFIEKNPGIKPEEGLTKKEFEMLRLALEENKKKEKDLAEQTKKTEEALIKKIKEAGATEGMAPEDASEQKIKEIQRIAGESFIFKKQEGMLKGETRFEEAKLYLRELRNFGCHYFLKYEGGIKGALRGFFTGQEKVSIVDRQGNPIRKKGKPVQFKASWWWHHPENDLVSFLREELKSKIQEKAKGEAFPEEEEMHMRQELDKEKEKNT